MGATVVDRWLQQAVSQCDDNYELTFEEQAMIPPEEHLRR